MLDPFCFSSRLAQAIQPTADAWNVSTLPPHVHEVIVAWVFYNIIFTVVSPFLSAKLFPTVYPRLPARSIVDWDTHATSLVQCSFMSVLTLFVIWHDEERKEMDWAGRLWGYTGACGLVQALAAGYFLWDLTASIRHYDALGLSSLLHAICALAVTLLGFRPFANYYGLNLMLYEMSNPFMNIHWFLKKTDMTGSAMHLVNGVMLLVTFCCFRVLWGSYQSACMYSDMWTALHTSNTDIVVEKGLSTDLPVWLAVVYLGSNTMLNLLNMWWFSLILQGFKQRFTSTKAGEKKG